jgi:hypothetical protein
MAAGVAQIDITPEEAIRLTGYGNRAAPTSEVRQRLWAKALTFAGGGRSRGVLITTDLIGLPARVTDEVARRLAKTGLDRAQVAITSTHTHTGPSIEHVRASRQRSRAIRGSSQTSWNGSRSMPSSTPGPRGWHGERAGPGSRRTGG